MEIDLDTVSLSLAYFNSENVVCAFWEEETEGGEKTGRVTQLGLTVGQLAQLVKFYRENKDAA